ncbi:MAG: PUA domain-containing protein [Nitrososphaeraceae archaeon]|jgi:conserved protein with predicted RNA binding PUA domain
MMKPLPLNAKDKIYCHIDAIFGVGISDILPEEGLQFEHSRRTGRIKNISIGSRLVATLRTDGGLALTLFGASELLKNKQFKENCVIPSDEAVPFVSEGRSLFCKHVEWCGSNVKVGSDVAIIDKNDRVVAIGRSLFGSKRMKKYHKGVAVKVREGIKSRVK